MKPSRLNALKIKSEGGLVPAFKKPPAGERGVLPTIGLLPREGLPVIRFPAALTATLAMLLFSAACDARADREQAADEQRDREMQANQRREDSAHTAMRDFLRRELPRREAQWASHRITRYRLAIRVMCFCEPPPLAIVTVGAESTTVTDALGRPLTPRLSSWLNFSVPKLFAEVRRAVADTNWSISARFDSTYGFPIEFNTENRTVSDIGYRAIVEGFEALAPAPSASRSLRQN